MSAGDLATVVVVLLAFGAFVLLLLGVQSLLRSLRELRVSLDRLHAETLPLLRELRTTVRDAGAEVDRVDSLLDAAESISHTVDSATRLSYLAFRAPVVRLVAFVKGVFRFIARLFGRRRSTDAGGARRTASGRAA